MSIQCCNTHRLRDMHTGVGAGDGLGVGSGVGELVGDGVGFCHTNVGVSLSLSLSAQWWYERAGSAHVCMHASVRAQTYILSCTCIAASSAPTHTHPCIRSSQQESKRKGEVRSIPGWETWLGWSWASLWEMVWGSAHVMITQVSVSR